LHQEQRRARVAQGAQRNASARSPSGGSSRGSRGMALNAWRQGARRLKRETYALFLVAKHPRVPWYAKALAICVVGYALSPLDLIPDFIPILGYLDDLLLVPLGIALVIRLTPRDLLAECRAQAQEAMDRGALARW